VITQTLKVDHYNQRETQTPREIRTQEKEKPKRKASGLKA